MGFVGSISLPGFLPKKKVFCVCVCKSPVLYDLRNDGLNVGTNILSNHSTFFAIKFWEIGTLESTYQVEPDTICTVWFYKH